MILIGERPIGKLLAPQPFSVKMTDSHEYKETPVVTATKLMASLSLLTLHSRSSLQINL